MNPLAYYTTQSLITNPGEYAELFDVLPHTIAGLRQVVQGVYIHFMAGREHEYEIPTERLAEIDTCYVEKMLARIIELGDRPLTEPRPPEKRLVGCCRDAALLFCAMARYQGIPTRTRVGFASYVTEFGPGFDIDHEIAEYWDADEKRWRLVDPDLLDLTIKENDLQFDVYDVPRDQFLVAGKAWQMCRTGEVDPDKFGADPDSHLKGWWFIRNRLVHDLAAQNKMELLLWDTWGLMDFGAEPTGRDLTLLDRVARLTQAGDEAFDEIRAIYEREAILKVPPVVTSYSPVGEPSEVTLPI
jgi:hypothetical protein